MLPRILRNCDDPIGDYRRSEDSLEAADAVCLRCPISVGSKAKVVKRIDKSARSHLNWRPEVVTMKDVWLTDRVFEHVLVPEVASSLPGKVSRAIMYLPAVIWIGERHLSIEEKISEARK